MKLKTKIPILSLFLFLIFCPPLFAGEVIPPKKLRQIELTASEGNLEKAQLQLEKLLLKYPQDGKGWDLLTNLRYKEWEDSKKSELFFQKITIQVNDSTGKKKEGTNDSLVNTLSNLFKSVRISDAPLAKLLYTARKATLFSNNAENAATVFRTMVLDVPADTGISDTAMELFSMAEEFFFQQNYEKASRYYREALALDSGFYQATFNLGEVYFFMGKNAAAIDILKKARNRAPYLIEPRKALFDAYQKAGDDNQALQEAVLSMLVIPEQDMMERIQLTAQKLKLNWSVSWIPRGIFPNTYNLPQEYKKFRMDFSEPFPPVAAGPWIFYEAARQKMDEFCDDRGVVVTRNNLSNSNYLEVFSWEEMLRNSNDPALEIARQMQKDGFLDCYVFITCFHFDLWEQYRDFAFKNQRKVEEYFKKYMR